MPKHPLFRPSSLKSATTLVPRFLTRSSQRFASSSSKPDNSHILAKPDKFRPPSHGSRLPKGGAAGRTTRYEPRNYPGPKESKETIEARKTKKYPHMFPPEGTVMHKFLTSRGIHLWISMSVLFVLGSFTWTVEFQRRSPYAHLLPSWSQLPLHPIDTISQFIHVMKMHSAHTTLETSERRKRQLEDVEKRRLYRVAHGLEEASEEDKQKAREKMQAKGMDPDEVHKELEEPLPQRRPVKKWLGIW